MLFEFLQVEDVANYRCIHSQCEEIVVNYAQMQLQDVLGQDLSIDDEGGHRTMDASLVQLLLANKCSIDELLMNSMCGVRPLSMRLFSGGSTTSRGSVRYVNRCRGKRWGIFSA